MPVIGTAGHVDHGKSTLIRALTGQDPDRWEEEKRRGLTIDLGFAWTSLGDVEISFVDVPGHERFVKNMLAGIEAVDAAILVVAADEGWMPQTEEHAVILDLLDIERVVVAVTKTDRVETTDRVRQEVRSKLTGLAFADAPLVDVSAPSGAGLDELVGHLGRLVERLDTVGPPVPHLWIDRAFSISGAGTVVTGTLQGGSIARGDRVTIQPSGLETRIRSIQTHEHPAEVVEPRRRVACNLGGVAVSDVSRGTLMVTNRPWRETDRILVEVRPARYSHLNERGAFAVHMGSGAWPARLQLLDEATAVLRLGRPAPAVFGAPFVLRESGRRLVVGGGRILDPAPSRRRAEILASGSALRAARGRDEAATALLEARGVSTTSDLARDTAGGSPRDGVPIGAHLCTDAAVTELIDRGTELLERFHADFPLRPGMPIASLAESLRLTAGGADDLATFAGWRRTGASVSLQGHETQLSPEDDDRWHRIRASLGPTLKVPRVKELDIDAELLAALIAQGRVVRVSDDLVFLPEQLATIESKIRAFTEPFTVSEFRQALDLSRKYAVPLLEWFDKQGVTQRRDDVRVVRA